MKRRRRHGRRRANRGTPPPKGAVDTMWARVTLGNEKYPSRQLKRARRMARAVRREQREAVRSARAAGLRRSVLEELHAYDDERGRNVIEDALEACR